MQIIPEYIVHVVCLNLCRWPIILSSPFLLFCFMPVAAEGSVCAGPTSHLEPLKSPCLGARLPQGLCNFPKRWPSSTAQVSGISVHLFVWSSCAPGSLGMALENWVTTQDKKIRPTVWIERFWNHLYHFCVLTKTPVQSGTLISILHFLLIRYFILAIVFTSMIAL